MFTRINPNCVKLQEKMKSDTEGCLSSVTVFYVCVRIQIFIVWMNFPTILKELISLKFDHMISEWKHPETFCASGWTF